MFLLLKSIGTTTIDWYENDGAATWTPAFTAADINISVNVARDLHIADMDRDGDLDIVSTSSGDNTIHFTKMMVLLILLGRLVIFLTQLLVKRYFC